MANKPAWTIHISQVPGYSRTISIVDANGVAVATIDGAGSLNPEVLRGVEANAELIAAAIPLRDALRDLLMERDDMLSNSEGRWPRLEGGCIYCTNGVTPDAHNTGPCPWHRAERLLARLPKSEATQ